MKLFKLSVLSVVTFLLLSSSAVQAQEKEDGIDVSGTVRVNYAYKDYSESSKDKGGDFAFDMAAIKFNGKLGDWGLVSEYRFFDGWQALRFGYGFYDVNPEWQLQFGV
jgi:opacity protein-like surface antigen